MYNLLFSFPFVIPTIIIVIGIGLFFSPLPSQSLLSRKSDRRWVIAVSLLAVLCSTLGNRLLLGLPGALVVILAAPVVELLSRLFSFSHIRLESMQGGVWAVFIVVTHIWPMIIPVMYGVIRRSQTKRGRNIRIVVSVVLAYVWSVFLCTYLMI
jgi:hypothetical protein